MRHWPPIAINLADTGPGSVYVALPSEIANQELDGHRYLAEARMRGAIGVVIDSRRLDCLPDPLIRRSIASDTLDPLLSPPEGFLVLRVASPLKALQEAAKGHRSQYGGRVVAITGSVGKTTTKELVTNVLARRTSVLKTPRSYNNEASVPATILQLSDEAWAILEFGAYRRGEISELCSIGQPHIGAVTNVGVSHLGRMGTLDNIEATKRELVDFIPHDGTVILNSDDPRTARMSSQSSGKVITFGQDPSATFRALDIRVGPEQTSFTLLHQDCGRSLSVPALGRHSVYAALVACAVGVEAGLDWLDIEMGLRSALSTQRLRLLYRSNGAAVLDDTYNSAPESLRAAIDFLETFQGERIAVIGEMAELGHLYDTAHREIGQYAAKVANSIIGVGGGGRIVVQAAKAAGIASRDVYWSADWQEAAEIAGALAVAGTTTLVKGSRVLHLEHVIERLLDTSR